MNGKGPDSNKRLSGFGGVGRANAAVQSGPGPGQVLSTPRRLRNVIDEEAVGAIPSFCELAAGIQVVAADHDGVHAVGRTIRASAGTVRDSAGQAAPNGR